MMRGFVMIMGASVFAACSAGSGAPTSLVADVASLGADDGPATGASSATVRVRCEARPGRSKISVDGNNLSPLNGRFSARVEARGGTVASGAATAEGDEAEFDFDSEADDILDGATPIPATFIAARSGPDVVGEILNAQGQVVARAGAECEFR